MLRRPSLRYVPYPYPSVGNTDQWMLQAEMMAENHGLSKRHLAGAKQLQAFTAQNLADARWLRDRLGWEHSFVEDSMLQGMLLARSSKKVAAKIKAAALAESQKEAEKIAAQGKQEEAVRSLLGPRGGLPSLKGDLIKLCHLLHLDVVSNDTVETLKEKIKPMLAILKVNPAEKSKAKVKASPEAAAPVSSLPTPSKPAQAPVTLADVNHLLGQQQDRFQSMLSQMLQHVMSSMSTPMQPQIPPEQSQTVPPGYGGGQWTHLVADALMRNEDLEPVDENAM